MNRNQKGAASKAAPASQAKNGFRAVRVPPAEVRYTLTPQSRALLARLANGEGKKP